MEKNKSTGKKNVKKNTNTSSEKKRKRSRWSTTSIILLVSGIVLVMGGAVLAWRIVENNKMKEVDSEDQAVQDILELYFYGNKGCFDNKNNFFSDKKVTLNTISQDIRDNIVISYLAYDRASSITYDEMNEVYHKFFGNSSDLTKKDSYSVIEGTYQLRESGENYKLTANCAPPELRTCIILDKAYKNDNYVEVDLKAFTIDKNTGKIYAGVNTEGESYENSILNEMSNVDLPKWKVIFKKNSNTDNYILNSASKI